MSDEHKQLVQITVELTGDLTPAQAAVCVWEKAGRPVHGLSDHYGRDEEDGETVTFVPIVMQVQRVQALNQEETI